MMHPAVLMTTVVLLELHHILAATTGIPRNPHQYILEIGILSSHSGVAVCASCGTCTVCDVGSRLRISTQDRFHRVLVLVIDPH